MTVGVYGIFCLDTGACLYVGQSKSIEKRFLQHLKFLRSGKHPREDFVDWFRSQSNNPEKMQLRVLEKTLDTDVEKNMSEIFWFNKLNPRFYGKIPSLNERWKHSEKTKELIRNSSKEYHRKRRESDHTENADSLPATCLFCESIIELKKYRKNKFFCSMDCYSKSRSKTLVITTDKVHELYHVKKLSLRESSKELGISHVALTKYMNKNGIPKRDRGESARLRNT